MDWDNLICNIGLNFIVFRIFILNKLFWYEKDLMFDVSCKDGLLNVIFMLIFNC